MPFSRAPSCAAARPLAVARKLICGDRYNDAVNHSHTSQQIPNNEPLSVHTMARTTQISRVHWQPELPPLFPNQHTSPDCELATLPDCDVRSSSIWHMMRIGKQRCLSLVAEPCSKLRDTRLSATRVGAAPDPCRHATIAESSWPLQGRQRRAGMCSARRATEFRGTPTRWPRRPTCNMLHRAFRQRSSCVAGRRCNGTRSQPGSQSRRSSSWWSGGHCTSSFRTTDTLDGNVRTASSVQGHSGATMRASSAICRCHTAAVTPRRSDSRISEVLSRGSGATRRSGTSRSPTRRRPRGSAPSVRGYEASRDAARACAGASSSRHDIRS